jgi:hypothetical protein
VVVYTAEMVPPTSTNETTGQRVDGLARSAQWRDVDAAHKAEQARKAAEANSDQHGDTAANSRYSPPTELRRSLMIPADQLPLDSAGSPESNAGHPNSGSRDTYMENLTAHAAGPARQAPIEPADVDDSHTATDRFSEQQAISPPRPVARQTIGPGTASLSSRPRPAAAGGDSTCLASLFAAPSPARARAGHRYQPSAAADPRSSPAAVAHPPASQAPAPSPSSSGVGGGSTSSTTTAISHVSIASSGTASHASTSPPAASSSLTSPPPAASHSQLAGPTGPAAILGPGHCNC